MTKPLSEVLECNQQAMKFWEAMTETPHFAYAQQIADIAASCDGGMSVLNRTEIDALHSIAHKLAGNRVHEIYFPEDSEEMAREFADRHDEL